MSKRHLHGCDKCGRLVNRRRLNLVVFPPDEGEPANSFEMCLKCRNGFDLPLLRQRVLDWMQAVGIENARIRWMRTGEVFKAVRTG